MKLRTGGLGADLGAFGHLLLGRRKAKSEEEKPDAETPEDKKEGGEDPAEENPEQDPPAEDAEGEEDKPDAEAIAAAARAEERARCRAIFAAPEAANNVALAAHLAFDTDQTAEQAVATLKLGGKAGGLGARMAAAPPVALGAGTPPKPGAGTPESAAAGILAAHRKATGKAA